jgi:hypothetical protein
MQAGKSSAEKPGYAWKVGAAVFSGLLFGIMLGVVSLLIRLVVGQEAFENSAGPIGSLLAAYILGGMVSGFVGGILFPFAGGQFGAILVGMASLVPITVIFGMRVFGPLASWDALEIGLSAAWTIILGTVGGLRVRRMFLEDPDLRLWW